MEAVRWVEECSRAKGSKRVMLRYMAEQSEGCIVVTASERLETAAGISRSQTFRVLQTLETERQAITIQGVNLESRKAYHLERWCVARSRMFSKFFGHNATGKCPQLSAFLERYGGSRIHATEYAYISGVQMRLVPEPEKGWEPVITHEELRWRANELRRRIGLPVLGEGPFQLQP